MENVEESNNDLCASIVRNNWERRILAGTTESGRSIYLISMELGKFFFSLPTDLDENSFFGKIKEWREIESRRGIMQKKIDELDSELIRKVPLMLAEHESALARIQRQKVELLKLRDKKLQEVAELNAEIERLNRVIANSGVDPAKAEKAAIYSAMRNFYETRGATLRLKGEDSSLATIFYGLAGAVGNDPYKEMLANEHGKLDTKIKKLVRKYFTSADDLRKGYANWRNKIGK